jgi:hypothetical protein
MGKIFYIWDYWLNRLPEPDERPKVKIIPFPGQAPEPFTEKTLEPFTERVQMEDFILLGYRRLPPGPRSRSYLAYYLPKTGPRFIRTCFLHEDEVTGEIELVSRGRIRGRFLPDKSEYTYTDAVHLASPNPDRRPEYLTEEMISSAAENQKEQA